MATDVIPWTQKYAPKTADDVKGQDSVIGQIRNYIVNYKSQKKRGLLVYGMSGCGKTSAIYALSNELGLEMVEINASDHRNKDAIERIVGSACMQMSLFGSGKIILIDEVDGLAGNKDRGGVQALIRILTKSRFPIIMTCNDPYHKKYAALRKAVEILQFQTLKYTTITARLKFICESEGITYDESAVKQLARQSDGDLRAAINDLQTITGNKKEFNLDDLDAIGERMRKEKIEDALVKVFKMKDASMTAGAFFNVSEDISAQMLWLDENIPKEYKKAGDVARAYDYLSRADVFLGRIRRWQHWRFMAVAGSLMSSGISVAKDEKYPGFVRYERPIRILEMWKAKMANMKKNAISEKIAEACHVSLKRAKNDILPYFKAIIKNNKSAADELCAELDLSSDELMWMNR